ncbi:predicted protein [Chaetoceros tenuissimus]|uniref:Uncharacterized protein n=1 Tax=Chaetoceros tenuissimus TaxID=426638 RepID=A0AAD3H801_9STRA|nr:predicted protein [Chaetoceros tenuissimus]
MSSATLRKKVRNQKTELNRLSTSLKKYKDVHQTAFRHAVLHSRQKKDAERQLKEKEESIASLKETIESLQFENSDLQKQMSKAAKLTSLKQSLCNHYTDLERKLEQDSKEKLASLERALQEHYCTKLFTATEDLERAMRQKLLSRMNTERVLLRQEFDNAVVSFKMVIPQLNQEIVDLQEQLLMKDIELSERKEVIHDLYQYHSRNDEFESISATIEEESSVASETNSECSDCIEELENISLSLADSSHHDQHDPVSEYTSVMNVTSEEESCSEQQDATTNVVIRELEQKVKELTAQVMELENSNAAAEVGLHIRAERFLETIQDIHELKDIPLSPEERLKKPMSPSKELKAEFLDKYGDLGKEILERMIRVKWPSTLIDTWIVGLLRLGLDKDALKKNILYTFLYLDVFCKAFRKAYIQTGIAGGPSGIKGNCEAGDLIHIVFKTFEGMHGNFSTMNPLESNQYGVNGCWYDAAKKALGIANAAKLRFLLIDMCQGPLPYDAMERLEEFEELLPQHHPLLQYFALLKECHEKFFKIVMSAVKLALDESGILVKSFVNRIADEGLDRFCDESDIVDHFEGTPMYNLYHQTNLNKSKKLYPKQFANMVKAVTGIMHASYAKDIGQTEEETLEQLKDYIGFIFKGLGL